VIEALREEFGREHEVIAIDGVRVVFPDGWGLIRASNTEPALTARFEGRTPERQRAIRQTMLAALARFPSVDLGPAAH